MIVRYSDATRELELSARGRELQELAAALEAVGAFAEGWREGEHIHVEYYEGHPYLAPASISLVLACLSGSPRSPDEEGGVTHGLKTTHPPPLIQRAD